MNEERTAKQGALSALKELVFWVGTLLFTLALFLAIKPLIEAEKYSIRTGVVAQSLMVVVLGVCGALCAYWFATKKLTAKRVIILLFVAGYALRVGYMLYTGAATRQQDTYTKNFDGHEAYAWTIFSTGKLPTSNVYQFYHPPLNAIVQASFMHFVSWLTQILPFGEYVPSAFLYGKPDYIVDEMRWFLYSSCQVLSVLYSLVACVGMLKILKLFHFQDKTRLLVAAFVVLFPRNVQFSGMLNNDGLSFALAIFALYFALKWQKQGKKMLNILLCGLCVGLGMMTKLSSATICLPIAGIFIFEFIDTLKKRKNALDFWDMALQYCSFLLVCAPIGLWFQVYAKVRFDQPFGYVFSNLNQLLYTGDHSFFSRFILCFDLSEYFGSLWCRPFNGNYYLFNYALRSAIFGEFSYWQGEGFAVLAVVAAYAFCTVLTVSLVYILVHWRKKCTCSRSLKGALDGGRVALNVISLKDFLFVALFMASQVLSEVYFYIQMPYGCTMDFRYIMPMILALALTLGYVQKALSSVQTQTARRLDLWLTILTCIFLVSSTLFYCVCI